MAASPKKRASATKVEAPPKRRLVNKRELCREAGISRTTLDERIASDPAFPIVRRGNGNGDSWEFDPVLAIAHLEKGRGVAADPTELSPNQQFMALRIIEKQRDMAVEAGGLLIAVQMSGALRRALLVLSRELRSMPASLAQDVKLSAAAQRQLRQAIEDRLRAFVTTLKATGLPDTDWSDVE